MINNCVFKTSYMSFFLVQSKVPNGGLLSLGFASVEQHHGIHAVIVALVLWHEVEKGSPRLVSGLRDKRHHLAGAGGIAYKFLAVDVLYVIKTMCKGAHNADRLVVSIAFSGYGKREMPDIGGIV